jgi:putative ABC transport system permease protein
MIYCSEIHMKTEEQNILNKTNGFNLDDMEKKLDSMEDETDNFYVPKLRILFRLNPFDLRFETRYYRMCIN